MYDKANDTQLGIPDEKHIYFLCHNPTAPQTNLPTINLSNIYYHQCKTGKFSAGQQTSEATLIRWNIFNVRKMYVQTSCHDLYINHKVMILRVNLLALVSLINI